MLLIWKHIPNPVVLQMGTLCSDKAIFITHVLASQDLILQTTLLFFPVYRKWIATKHGVSFDGPCSSYNKSTVHVILVSCNMC